MDKKIIKSKLFAEDSKKRFLLLDGDFENFVIKNHLVYICDIEINYNNNSQYYNLKYNNNIYNKYKGSGYSALTPFLYFENDKLLLQDNTIEFKDLENMFQVDGKGIIEIDGNLHNLIIKQM
jgi:hypothetical protein